MIGDEHDPAGFGDPLDVVGLDAKVVAVDRRDGGEHALDVVRGVPESVVAQVVEVGAGDLVDLRGQLRIGNGVAQGSDGFDKAREDVVDDRVAIHRGTIARGSARLPGAVAKSKTTKSRKQGSGPDGEHRKVIARNKQARRNFEIEADVEAGLVLTGRSRSSARR